MHEETPNQTQFPTGKPHVSASEIKSWRECGWKHKLAYVDKVGTFTASVHTEFGTAVHSAAEKFLKTRQIDIEMAHRLIESAWEKNCFDDLETIQKQIADARKADYEFKYFPCSVWKEWAKTILEDLPVWMDERFGKEWVFIAAEDELYEPISADESVKFKGFIDGVIGAVDKRGNQKIWIIDWKTAGPGGWMLDKKRDFMTQFQIAAYKVYWSKKANVAIKDIGCTYILLKRQAKKGKAISDVTVSVGPKMIQKVEKLVLDMVKTVRKKFFLKNRNSCKFCEFKDTKYCT